MPVPTTAAGFLDVVRKSGVLEEIRLDKFVNQHQASAELSGAPGALAKLMLREGLLTHFQAEQLLQGKSKRFIISGKYMLLEHLGTGGMGSVYLCQHKVMQRRVAIKVLPASKSNDRASLERFHREARAVAALDHPNIVRAHDIDHDNDLHFLVMEFVDGASLQEVVKRFGPMGIERAANYIAQAALGLEHAHEAGLVHRDIKPGNLLIDRAGTVKILDMGLARFFNDTSDNITKNHDESVLGTADYIAPEQAVDSNVDIRADIYSLGITFYFLLTGATPFGEGNAAQKMIWHQVRVPKPIREVRPEVPAEIDAVVAKMIAKNPADRFQAPGEICQALRQWMDMEIPPPPDKEMPRLSPAASGSKADGSIPGASTPRRSKPSSAATAPRHTGSANRNATPRPHRPGATAVVNRHPPSTHVLGSRPQAEAADGNGAGPWLGSAPDTDDARGSAETRSNAPSDGSSSSARRLLAVPMAPATWNKLQIWWVLIAVSIMALTSLAGFLWWTVIAAVTRTPPPPSVIEGPPRMPGHVPLGKELTRMEGHMGKVYLVSLSPDGHKAVSGSDDHTARLWNIDTGKEIRRFEGHEKQVFGAALSPDGRYVLTGSEDGTACLWDADTGQKIRTLEGHQSGVFGVAFSPDGKFALTGSADKTARLWEVATGKEVRVFEGHTHHVMIVAFSSDGKRILTGSWDSTAILWDRETGNQLRIYRGHTAEINGVAFSPDEKFVLTGSSDKTVRLWEIQSGKELRVFKGDTQGSSGVAFSPDGRKVMAGSADTVIRVWNLGSGLEVAHLEGHSGAVVDLHFFPDGERVVSSSFDKTLRVWRLPK